MSEIRVNTIVAAEGTSAPLLPYGVSVPTGMGITGAGGVNITGVVTATSFSGSGSALTGIAVTQNVRTESITVSGVSTFTGALNATSVVSSGAVSGTTGTFSGAVNVDATTDSTSTTSGALIFDGGLGVAKNVYIGAGLSVAGTLTYEDVTNVDSVGLITAKSGVNISGGELKVGSAVTVSGVGGATFIGAAGVAVTITPSTGKVQATYIEGPLTGNVTGNVTGNLNGTVNTGSQTNITSLGSLSALTVTGDLTLDNGSDAGKDLTWDVSADALIFNDSVYANFGTDSDLKVWHDGSNGYVRNTTGSFLVEAKSGENAIVAVPDEEVKLYHNGNEKFKTTNDGVVITGICTDSLGNLRYLPPDSKSGAYVLVAGDAGKAIYISTGGVTVNQNIIPAGGMVTIINNSGSSQTITQGSSVNLYNTADGNTGNKTLTTRGTATLWSYDGTAIYITGNI